MITPQLLDYVAQQLQQGVSQDQIRSSLLANGWQEADVSEAFASINARNMSTQPGIVRPGQFPGGFQQSSQKPNNAPLIVALVLFVMLIGAVGAAFAFGFIRLFQASPESVVRNMMIRLGDVKTLEYRGESKTTMVTTVPVWGVGMPLQQQGADGQENEFVFIGQFRGKSDYRDPNNIKELMTFDVESVMTDEQGRETREPAYGFELRLIGHVLYLRLNHLADMGPFGTDFLTRQWIKIEFDEIIKALEEHLGEIPEEYRHRIGEVREMLEISQEEQRELESAFLRHNLLTITETLPSENIEGVSSHRYRFTIEEEALRGFITDAIAILAPDSITQDEEIMGEIRTGIDEFFANAEPMTGEIWIGKRDYLPRKLLLTLATTMPDIGESKSTTTMFFENFNEPVQIDVPSPAKGIVEFIQEAMQEMFGGLEGGA